MRKSLGGIAALMLLAGTAGAQTNLITGSGVWSSSDQDHCPAPAWDGAATNTPPTYNTAVSTTATFGCVFTFTQPVTLSGPVTGTVQFGYTFFPSFPPHEWPHFQPVVTLAWGDCHAAVTIDTVLVNNYYPVAQQSSTTCHSETVPTSFTFSTSVPIFSALYVTDAQFTAVSDAVAPEPSALILLATGLVPMAGGLIRRAR